MRESVPVIIIGNIQKQSFEVFESGNAGCYQKRPCYVSPKIIALHVKQTDNL